MGTDMKMMARRFSDELWAQGGQAVVDDLFTNDFRNHSPGQEAFGVSPDKEGYKKLIGMFVTAFPDLSTRTEDVITEGDKVVLRWTGSGTHQADFAGIPASGKRITLGGTTILRIADGKITEEWSYGDQLGLMVQLGAVQLPAQPVGAYR